MLKKLVAEKWFLCLKMSIFWFKKMFLWLKNVVVENVCCGKNKVVVLIKTVVVVVKNGCCSKKIVVLVKSDCVVKISGSCGK